MKNTEGSPIVTLGEIDPEAIKLLIAERDALRMALNKYSEDELLCNTAKDGAILRLTSERHTDTELLRKALDALEESVDLVVIEVREYEKWHGTRRAKIDGMRQYAEQHRAVITAIRERL